MNKKAYWVVGVVIIAIVVVVWLSFGKSVPADKQQPVKAAAVRSTIHDLINSDATQMCTFSVAATATSSSMSGTVYMASKNMQGDFVVKDAAEKITNAHMIISNNTVYLWSDTSSSKGVKVSWSLASSSNALSAKGGVDVNQPTEYSCSSWTPDLSKFTIPTNIQFIDVSGLIRTSTPVK